MNTTQLAEKGVKAISEYDLEKRYLDMLNECHETVTICGYEYQAGDALLNVDPIAYNCGYSDWLSAELGNTIVEIDGEYFDKDDVDSFE